MFSNGMDQTQQLDSDRLPLQIKSYSQDPTSNVIDLMKQVEERTKREVEDQYQVKLKALESKASYLDRSLELIEEMKEKFQHFEGQ